MLTFYIFFDARNKFLCILCKNKLRGRVVKIVILLISICGLLMGVDHSKAARSVHLVYKGEEGNCFYNEIEVKESQMGTYFCVLGFNHGYYGLQEREDGKWLIFSIWDPGKQDDPEIVESEKRVRLLYKDDNVVTGRFGNEGTGGQSFYKYDWKIDENYKFMVTSNINGDRTEYTSWFYLNEESRWIKLVTFDTITLGDNLKGYYSFVEDFRRDGKSIGEVRTAHFSNGWIRFLDGEWKSLQEAKFSADKNVWINIDGGQLGSKFYLKTGGETIMKNKLWSNIKLSSPINLPKDF